MRDHGPRGRDVSSTEDWSNLEDLSRFESRWRSGDRGSIERSLAETDPSRAPGVLSLLIEAEIRLRREAGERPSSGEYLARFPEHADLIDAAFESLGETWIREGDEGGPGHTEQFPGSDGRFPTAIDRDATEHADGATAGEAHSPKDGCRYRIVSRHDGGGLGEIFIADDLELNRAVALKEIRELLAADSQARARFLLEAEVIGKLEHPGIVPIYGKGRYRDGRPYYAMRFIQGESLRDAIARFHEERAGRSASENELTFRGLLGRFVDICNAIEYAHSRGVVHRDIKPRNVMLGRFGETLVVDWGLAKVLGVDWDVDATDFPFRALAADGVDPTRMDKALGTLRYMSPEQAAGRVDLVGPASDVFGLGATLYCLLTGRAPYGGSSPEEVKERAIRGDFPPPREARRDVPAPLESVCLKAMKRDRDDRYPSARALADDVERWLADEPVSAHAYPATARVARWVRRHRPQVGIASALLLSALIAAISLLEVRAEKGRANENFKLALDSVDQMLDRVSDRRLVRVPGMTGLRRELGDDAVEFLKKLVDQHPEDPDLRWRYADICIGAANNHLLAGRLGRYFQYYDQIIATFRGLVADYPEKLGYRHALVGAQLSRGNALRESGDFKSALASLRRSLKEAERLRAMRLRSADYGTLLARARLLLGEVLVQVGDHEGARVGLDSAIEILPALVQEQPDDIMSRRLLTYAYCLRGAVAAESSDPVRAKLAFDRGAGVLDEWMKRPEAPRVEIDYHRAILLNEQGRWLASVEGSMEDSERAHDRAVGAMAELCRDYPDILEYRIEHAWGLLNRGLVRSRLGAEKREAAGEDLARATESLAPAARDNPDFVRADSTLGRAKGALGRFLLDRGDRERAIPLLGEAIKLQERCLSKNEASPRDRQALEEHQDGLRRARGGQ